jgi:membrane-associated phospholipid phosphatase
VSTSEFAQARAESAAGLRFPRWELMRRCALGLYVVALGLWSAHYGIPVQRELVILWTCGALACVSLGRPPREILQLLLDWLPIVAVLAVYDITRGAADSFGIGVHYQPMIDFDRALFGGETPTEWLQARFYDPGVVHWYDVGFTLVYTSYFIVPFAVAGFLWARDRLAFLRFTKRLVTLSIAGLATYVAFPAAPPWMAGEMGLIHEVHRTTGKGWEVLGVGTAALFREGQAGVNLVAAVPSLHSAITALVALFLWPRVRRPLRPLLLLYPLAMGLTLMATGEHYFFDVLLGWIYAGAVMAGWAWWEHRRTSRVPASRLAAESPR